MADRPFRRPVRASQSAVAVSFGLTAFLACAPAGVSPPAARATLAIEGVSVIPMDSERVVAGVTVLIGGRRVLAVRSSADATVPEDAIRVDGLGRFLIPGLNDMHVHFREERALARFLATGVTGVRILSGGPQTLDFRDRVRRGELAGPDIHTAGIIIEG